MQIFSDATLFQLEIQNFIQNQEARFNLFCGLLDRTIESNASSVTLMGLYLDSSEQIRVAFLKTPNRNLVLSGDDFSDVPELVHDLYDFAPNIPGIVAPYKLGLHFGQCWQQRSGKDFNIIHEQGIYQLGHLSLHPQTHGKFHYATLDDLEWLMNASQKFYQESIPYEHYCPETVREFLLIHIKLNRIGLWKDNSEICAFGVLLRPIKETICIGYIYTDSKYRNKGYATAITHGLCLEAKLQKFSRVVLYTDLSNAPSNHLYKKLGFQLIDKGIVGKL